MLELGIVALAIAVAVCLLWEIAEHVYDEWQARG